MRRILSSIVAISVSALIVSAASSLIADDGWGSLTGQIVYDGKPAAPKPIQVTKDPQVCGKFNLKEEKMIVNSDNGGIANVGVWLSVAKTDKVKPEIHPDLKDLANQKVVIDNKDCRFAPHVSVVWTEQTVELGNADPVGHNTKINTLNSANAQVNQVIPATKTLDHKFKAEEKLPVKVECSIHPWMNGWVIVKDTPYAVVTDEDGKFTIEKLPAGQWKFTFWQEDIGYLQDVNVNGKAEKWKKGEVQVKIEDGKATDLGVIKVKKKG